MAIGFVERRRLPREEGPRKANSNGGEIRRSGTRNDSVLPWIRISGACVLDSANVWSGSHNYPSRSIFCIPCLPMQSGRHYSPVESLVVFCARQFERSAVLSDLFTRAATFASSQWARGLVCLFPRRRRIRRAIMDCYLPSEREDHVNRISRYLGPWNKRRPELPEEMIFIARI